MQLDKTNIHVVSQEKGLMVNVKVNEIAHLGSNVKTWIKDENCTVFMLNDSTGEGVMTIYRVMPGIILCLSDMQMEKCNSEFELQKDRKIFCVDHCREGRLEMEVQPGVFSIMQENELRLDNRENHKGTTYYPLRHYHGVSIFMDVGEAGQTLDEMFHGFSADLEGLRKRYCEGKAPYVISGNEKLNEIISGFYPANMEVPGVLEAKEYYQIKVVELLLYLEKMTIQDSGHTKPYYYRTQMEKIKAIHARITGDLREKYTIEELSSMYDIPATTMKKCFKDVYGDSIYSYQKRYRINIAANMLMQEEKRKIQEIAACVGYENPGKFSSAFRDVMGVTPAEYRIRKEGMR